MQPETLIHCPVSLYYLIFGSSSFAVHNLSGHEPAPFWFGVCCVLFVGLCLVCLTGSGSYLLTPFLEFISGDLCLSAHTAPLPVQKKTLHTRTDACLNVVSWKQELSRFPCRQILTGWSRPPVRAASSCKLLTCPERTSSKYWARPLQTAHSCNNSAFPETYEL